MRALFMMLLTIISILFNDISYARPLHFSAKLCGSNEYSCYKVKRGDRWENLFPNANEKDLVMRVNRIGIQLRPGMYIAIPKNLSSLTLMDISPFPLQLNDIPGKRIIFVSLRYLAWGAYDEKGNLVRWGPVSGGQGYCPDIHRACHTPVGKFSVYHKEGSGCFSTKYPVSRGGAPMPYCMFFHGGYALHGSYEVPGYNASHGCVRLFVMDAEWLNHEFVDIGTPVVITY